MLTNWRRLVAGDFGHYRPLYSCESRWRGPAPTTYTTGAAVRASGMLRSAPVGLLADNANLDKARRLLSPVKKKYGRKDRGPGSMVLTGNVALESMGFKTFGFAGGREDKWSPAGQLGVDERGSEPALQRRPALARNPVRAVPNGSHLRESRRPNSSHPVAPRHSRNLPAHGDERRGTIAHHAAGTRSAKPWRGPCDHVGPEPEGATSRAGFRLEGGYETGTNATPSQAVLRGHPDHDADEVGNDFFKRLLRVQNRSSPQPGWREAVETEEQRR